MKKDSDVTQDNHCRTWFAKIGGFTLAEALITLAVIGVVTAITMPMLITNVRNHIKAERIKNIDQKFSKATDKMVALGVYNGHGSTAEFVNELGKHLKLAKVCDNSHLASCWPYSEVQLSNDKMWDISKTKTGKTMKMENKDGAEWDDTMGIITADGTSIILSYNKQCAIDDTQPITYPKTNNEAGKMERRLSSTTKCVAAIYDWNGATKPNKYSDDVLALNSNGLGSSCAIEVGDLCLTAPFTPKPITKVECDELKSSLDIDSCQSLFDYWAGAVKQCGGVSKMPSAAHLAKLAQEMYTQNGYKPTIGAEQYVTNLTFQVNSPIAQALGLTPEFKLWSGEGYTSGNANGRYFLSNRTQWRPGNRNDSDKQAVCIGD